MSRKMNTLHKITLPSGNEYLLGDKLLRIIFAIVTTIELGLIIYLLVR